MDTELHDLVARHWSIRGTATPLLGAGDECLIWRLVGPLDAVVRVSPSWRSKQELTWAFSVANSFRRHVPEATVPLPAADGESVVMWGDRPVSVWLFIDGLQLDRDNHRQRGEAARLLASLHRAALVMGRLEPRPGPQRILHIAPLQGVLSDPHLDVQLDLWHSSLAENAPHGPLHGDFYRRNILCRSDRAIGLVDWDDARLDYLETELAWAVWEFAKSPMDEWSPDRAADFLRAYEDADGPVQGSRFLIALIRNHLRDEVRQAQLAQDRGDPIDKDYYESEVAAFWQLRGVHLAG